MADLTCFWNTKIDGLFFTSAASFQILGKLKIGNLFTDAKWWAGTYKLSALRKSRLGLRTLLMSELQGDQRGVAPADC
jgi:hypothetical protein